MADIQSGCNILLNASMSENTKAVYQNGLKCFAEFRSNYSFNQDWPVPVSHAAAFISFCFQQGYSPATVTTYMSAVRYIHKLRDLPDPSQSFLIRKILEGFKRLKSTNIRAPITKKILMKLVLALPQGCYNEYESILFKAMFSLAYFGLFRVGELAATNYYQAGYALQLSDLTFTHEKLVVGIRFSKTNQTGKPVFLNIKKVDDKNICPLVNMQQFLRLRSSRPGNLFIHANELPVTRYQFGAILIKAIAQVGLSSSYYKSHSFRIGRATDLAVAGVSCDEIKASGRWQSSCFNTYVRQ